MVHHHPLHTRLHLSSTSSTAAGSAISTHPRQHHTESTLASPPTIRLPHPKDLNPNSARPQVSTYTHSPPKQQGYTDSIVHHHRPHPLPTSRTTKMIWTLLLLPLAFARPHLPDSIAHRRQARALLDRAGAAYDNETQAEYSAWEQEHLSNTAVVSQSAVSTASAAVDSAVSTNTNTPTGIQAVGSALTAVNTPSPTASPVESSAQVGLSFPW